MNIVNEAFPVAPVIVLARRRARVGLLVSVSALAVGSCAIVDT